MAISISRSAYCRTRLAVVAATAVAISACASTRIQRSWAKEDLGPLNFHQVVAIAITKSPETRRVMEESMAGEIRRLAPRVDAVPSYSIIPDSELAHESFVRDQINRAGFDGAVFMRVTNVARRDVFIPGEVTAVPEYYRTFWGYYRYWMPIAYEPGYVEHDRDVRVETDVYATAGNGDLLYSAVSSTINPDSPQDLVRAVSGVVAQDMKEKGLIRTDSRDSRDRY